MRDNSFNSKIFFPTLVIVAVLVFVIMVNFQKTYRAETDVLIIPKTENLTSNLSQVAGNAMQIPRSLSFYEKLLELYPDLDDTFLGLESSAKKAAWNKSLVISRIGSSGVLRFGVVNENQWQAEMASGKVANDVIYVMGRYYNQEKALIDMRIIDRPVVSQVPKMKFWPALISSFALGLLLAAMVNILYALFWNYSATEMPLMPMGKEKKFMERINPFQISRTDEEFRLEKELQKPAPEMIVEEKKEVIQKTVEFSQKPKVIFDDKKIATDTGSKKAFAPSNLPIADDTISSLLKNAEVAPVEKNEEKEAEPDKGYYREATPEEVKERLNRLLRGN